MLPYTGDENHFRYCYGMCRWCDCLAVVARARAVRQKLHELRQAFGLEDLLLYTRGMDLIGITFLRINPVFLRTGFCNGVRAKSGACPVIEVHFNLRMIDTRTA